MISSPIVLLYHRVEDLPFDPQLLCVSISNFEHHLEILRQFCQPLPLHEMIARQKKGVLDPNSIAITFDDGYGDNFYHARPVLERYGIPATFFITTGNMGKHFEFWWDELERIIFTDNPLPPILDLNVNGFKFHWSIENDSQAFSAPLPCCNDWHVLSSGKRSDAQNLYVELCTRMRLLGIDMQETLLTCLRAWAGTREVGRSTHRAMTEDEVRALSENCLFEIGSHTISHPVLSSLKISEQLNEIKLSNQTLERITGKRIRAFSYPFGGKDDYNTDTMNLLKNKGFEFACSNFEGSIGHALDAYQIPRHIVRNWPRDEFIDWLKNRPI